MKAKKSTPVAPEAGIRAAVARSAKETPVQVPQGPPKVVALPARPPVPSARAPEMETQKLLAELSSLRRMMEKLCAPLPAADASLESSVDSMRRLLTDLLESRLEPVIAEVAEIRSMAAAPSKAKGRSVVDHLDLLLNDLGAIRFEAQRLDYFDPLIHQVTAERKDMDAPDHVILETVVPGYRTARGRIVAKAGVTINRRD